MKRRAALGRLCVYGAQKIRLDAVRLQQTDVRGNPVIGRMPCGIRPECIMHRGGAVQAHADIEMLLGEKTAPRIIQREPVGLEIIPALPAFGSICF